MKLLLNNAGGAFPKLILPQVFGLVAAGLAGRATLAAPEPVDEPLPLAGTGGHGHAGGTGGNP